MRCLPYIILGALTFSGCYDISEKETLTLNPEIDFTVSFQMAAGKNISSLLAFDENNYFFSIGNQIFCVEDSKNFQIEVTSDVLALARNETDKLLWLGTKSSGLGRLNEGQITYFTQKKDKLPRDLISYLVCDSEGAVWFSSSAHQLGGLGRYYKGEFRFYTPENSALPDNLIKSIACLGDKIFVVTGGTVTQQKVVSIDENKWKTLPIQGYYLMDMDVDQDGKVYVIDDTGLSSTMMTNKIYLYDYNKCRNILPNGSWSEFWPHRLKTDLRNYLWVAKFSSQNNRNLAVFDGETWHEAPSDFPDMFINCIAVDKNNAIWLGTTDGIYILNQ
jgi:ligand-binding sensor domain-containing protein